MGVAVSSVPSVFSVAQGWFSGDGAVVKKDKDSMLINTCRRVATVLFASLAGVAAAAPVAPPFAGADNSTPAKAMYFSWINNGWEGGDEAQTLVNFEFFKWLHDTYGMSLDIYLFDCGNVDGAVIDMLAPRFDKAQQSYESATLPIGKKDVPRRLLYNDKVFHAGAPVMKEKYPNGFTGIAGKFATLGTRIGVWVGPDGYGTTPEDAEARRNFLVGLARDNNMALFKFDSCCSPLRRDKQDEFAKTMTEVRRHVPDLIALNHRISLNPDALRHMTTFLWNGLETYVDVHIHNKQTATHARVHNLDRGLPRGLSRNTEDHGVCLSSCLDYWQDDLIMQAFNRNFIMAPEIYGNPWLLTDRELAELARIFNLHRQYNDILVNGILLPKTYGRHAVSRGDDSTRLITLVNLNWQRSTRTLTLGEEIGLKDNGTDYEIRQFHPTEKILGRARFGEKLDVSVEPFRAALIRVTPIAKSGFGIEGVSYQVLKEKDGKFAEVELLGAPGETANARVVFNGTGVDALRFTLDGTAVPSTSAFSPTFSGTPLKKESHRWLTSEFAPIPVPADAEQQLETLLFDADNNALEVRSLKRSGATRVPQVQAARDAFFQNPLFVELGVWDKQLFDGNLATGFSHNFSRYEAINAGTKAKSKSRIWGTFRLDIGAVTALDTLEFKGLSSGYTCEKVEASTDLKTWETPAFSQTGDTLKITLGGAGYRYFRVGKSPQFVAEIEGRRDGQLVPRTHWRANNLFRHYAERPVQVAFKAEIELNEAAPGSYLAVPLEGKHGDEGAYVVLKVGGKYIGSPERIVSYPSNAWEMGVVRRGDNYTYLFPVTPEMLGKPIEVCVLSLDAKNAAFKPSVWITSAFPYVTQKLVYTSGLTGSGK
ncbi:MAG: hypothetical protein LBV28_00755 [Puniceicoccales bacterium]|nr:hypothetical protein [Puniceicoccales bacterium]